MRYWLWALVLNLWAAQASARVERFALIMGNDQGAAHQAQLRYAISDASRLYDVLRDLGGFEPVDMVFLRNESADVARRTLISLNDRIRHARELPNTQVMLVVYYSGHGDAESLQLGATELGLTELAQLVRGSAADFRVLILDACRSGSLTTRSKGGRVVDAFALPEEELEGAGLAYLTASSADEDAQESDELKASFFTQAFVSALLGAADANQDGAISLDEAYRYAYDATLRATSTTRAGAQHPTFRYDLSGQGALVLTRPKEYAQERALVNFPNELPFLILRGDADGPVVAEIRRGGSRRTVSLPPGQYLLRGRGEHVLYEAELNAEAGQSIDVALTQMRRVEYSRLVRMGQKGGSGSEALAHKLYAGALLRSALPNSETPCVGAMGAYGVDFAQLGLEARMSACTSSFENAHLHADTRAYDVALRAYHAWDYGPSAWALGLGAGLTLFSERFETAGTARDRDSLVPFVAISGNVEVDLHAQFFLTFDAAGETYFLRLQGVEREPVRHAVDFAVRGAVALGARL